MNVSVERERGIRLYVERVHTERFPHVNINVCIYENTDGPHVLRCVLCLTSVAICNVSVHIEIT